MGRRIARILIDNPWSAALLKNDIVIFISETTVEIIHSKHPNHGSSKTWQVNPIDVKFLDSELSKLQKLIYNIE